MSEVESIDKNKPHFNVMAICMAPNFDDVYWHAEVCGHRWIGTVIKETSLFHLECPKCGSKNSFASFLPNDYFN